MKSKGFSTSELIQKIEKLTHERMVGANVVDLAEVRILKHKLRPPTLLVVEDDESVRLVLRRLFEGEGFHVKTAGDGTQLCTVLDDQPIDLILLDIGLPWLNGFELAELLKSHRTLKNIPLVFVTGQTDQEYVQRGFDVGADDVIFKPFHLKKVLRTVRNLIQQNQRTVSDLQE